MQVMTTGQRLTLEYHGNGFILTVNQAVVEGKEKSNSIERGVISTETYIVFEAPKSSGIKVNFFWSLPYALLSHFVVKLSFQMIVFFSWNCILTQNLYACSLVSCPCYFE